MKQESEWTKHPINPKTAEMLGMKIGDVKIISDSNGIDAVFNAQVIPLGNSGRISISKRYVNREAIVIIFRRDYSMQDKTGHMIERS